jgi:hypothetical protein
MQDLLRHVASDSFFAFGFNHGDERIYLTRGASRRRDYTGKVFAARSQAIADFLG